MFSDSSFSSFTSLQVMEFMEINEEASNHLEEETSCPL